MKINSSYNEVAQSYFSVSGSVILQKLIRIFILILSKTYPFISYIHMCYVPYFITLIPSFIFVTEVNKQFKSYTVIS